MGLNGNLYRRSRRQSDTLDIADPHGISHNVNECLSIVLVSLTGVVTDDCRHTKHTGLFVGVNDGLTGTSVAITEFPAPAIGLKVRLGVKLDGPWYPAKNIAGGYRDHFEGEAVWSAVSPHVVPQSTARRPSSRCRSVWPRQVVQSDVRMTCIDTG